MVSETGDNPRIQTRPPTLVVYLLDSARFYAPGRSMTTMLGCRGVRHPRGMVKGGSRLEGILRVRANGLHGEIHLLRTTHPRRNAETGWRTWNQGYHWSACHASGAVDTIAANGGDGVQQEYPWYVCCSTGAVDTNTVLDGY